jgi:hypothetical protein
MMMWYSLWYRDARTIRHVAECFLSSSTEKAAAVVAATGRPVTSVMFTIHSKTGRDISPHCGSHQHEAEVLFRPGTLFKVKDVVETQTKSGGVHKEVTMEEVAV